MVEGLLFAEFIDELTKAPISTIIKHQKTTSSNVIGFDIFTQQVVVVSIKDCYQVPDVVVSILGNNESRYILAKAVSKKDTNEDISKILNCSSRTVHRMSDRLGYESHGLKNK